MVEYKVVFHIDEMNKWNLLLGNVNNLVKAIASKEFSIEVVANSAAVGFYESSEAFDDKRNLMSILNNEGVKFVACNNALVGNGINKDDLEEFVQIVPAGVLELVDKQREGYAYIKP